MSNLIGQSLGRYHILEQLGEGGMATVYKAYDTRLERDVAVKIIRRGAFPPEQLERSLKRFEREAKALARMTHPYIVPVIDYGEHEGAPYLVMPYLPGGTLKQRLGKPLPWQEAVHLLLPVTEALEYAHEQNIIHRDIKPSNILLTNKGKPMLSDFGIAKILDLEDGQTLTATGVGIGTAEYMSPEQGMGKPVGPGTDIYSLGVVLYELLTGRKPYTADTPMSVVDKHLHDPLPSPRQYVPDLPEAVEKVLLKALAKQPEDRYMDMALFAAAFESLPPGQSQASQPVENPTTVPNPLPEDPMETIERTLTPDEMLLSTPASPSKINNQPSNPVLEGKKGKPDVKVTPPSRMRDSRIIIDQGKKKQTRLQGENTGPETKPLDDVERQLTTKPKRARRRNPSIGYKILFGAVFLVGLLIILAVVGPFRKIVFPPTSTATATPHLALTTTIMKTHTPTTMNTLTPTIMNTSTPVPSRTRTPMPTPTAKPLHTNTPLPPPTKTRLPPPPPTDTELPPPSPTPTWAPP